MSRMYPQFIFSNPKNTKSEGPFVVSLIPPILICKAVSANDPLVFSDDYCKQGNVGVYLLARPIKEYDDGISHGEDVKKMLKRMAIWLYSQVQTGAIDWRP